MSNQVTPKSIQAGIPRLTKPRAGYKQVKLGDILYEEKRPIKMLDSKRYRLVTVKRSRGGIEERSKLLGKAISVKSQFKIAENDFLISKRQIVHGACVLVPKEFEGSIVSNEYAVLRARPELDIRYLKYLSHSVYFQQTCFHSSIGVHVEKMIFKLADWFNWSINLPKLEEQQKIANFLTSVDTKIQQLKRKHTLMQQYKKGVMQQLFSQQVRFKSDDGQYYPEWEKSRFGELFERITRKNKKDCKNVMTISAQQGLINQKEYFNKSVSATDVTGYYLLRKGEFAYNKSYSAGYPLGAIKKLQRYEEGVLSTLYICFKAKENIAPEFYEQYFEGGLLNHEIQKIAQEGARNHGLLNISVVEFFRDIVLHLPSFEEQQRIADVLASIDKKIDQISTQITQAKTFKKGLLQQMFV